MSKFNVLSEQNVWGTVDIDKRNKLFKLLALMLAMNGKSEREIIEIITAIRQKIPSGGDNQTDFVQWIKNAEKGKVRKAKAYGRQIVIKILESIEKLYFNNNLITESDNECIEAVLLLKKYNVSSDLIYEGNEIVILEAKISGVLSALGVDDPDSIMGQFGLQDREFDIGGLTRFLASSGGSAKVAIDKIIVNFNKNV